MMRYIDLFYFRAWRWLGEGLAGIAIWFMKMALSHYAAARTNEPFAVRKLDSSIYVAAYVNQDKILCIDTVWAPEDPSRAKRKIEKEKGVTVVYFENIATLREDILHPGEVVYL